jgi:hypothetical protein
MLPIVIAAASFTAQTHIGLLPVAATVTACAVAAGIRRTAIATWATAWSAPLRPGLSAPYGNRLELRKDAETATAVAAAIPLLFVFGSWAAHRRRPVEAWCCRLSGVASIVALIAVQRIRGGIADHLVPWVTVISLVSVASLAAVTCLWFGERFPVLASRGSSFAAMHGPRWLASSFSCASGTFQWRCRRTLCGCSGLHSLQAAMKTPS